MIITVTNDKNKNKSAIPRQDNVIRLGKYIEAAPQENEKREHLWIKNCLAGENEEDLDYALKEMYATQKMNERVKEKTYHIVVSFHPDDKKLSKTNLQDIDDRVTKILGFEKHQRVVATHVDQKHYHMHIAYNMIHPETFMKHEPWQKHRELQSLAKSLEKQYGLIQIDRDKYKDKSLKSAMDYEAHTWQQSFYSYALEHKEHIDNIRNNKSATWQDLHEAFAKYGMRLKPSGNGFKIETCNNDNHAANDNGNRKKLKEKTHRIKASDFGRDYSKKSLEKDLGDYQEYIANDKLKVIGKYQSESDLKPTKEYKAKPLAKHTNQQKQASLWRKYLHLKSSPFQAPLSHRNVTNWKQYLLLLESLNDPLAMVIIETYRKMSQSSHVSVSKTSNTSKAPIKTSANDNYVKPILDDTVTPEAELKSFIQDIGFNVNDNIKFDGKKHNITNDKNAKGGYIAYDNDGFIGAIVFNVKDKTKQQWIYSHNVLKSISSYINKSEDKRNQKSHFVIDTDKRLEKDNTPIIITRDYNSAASLSIVSGLPVFIAHSADNIKLVADLIKQKYNDRQLIIATDNNANDNRIIEKAKLASKKINAILIQPNQQYLGSGNITFHDVHKKLGAEAVLRTIQQHKKLAGANSKEKELKPLERQIDIDL